MNMKQCSVLLKWTRFVLHDAMKNDVQRCERVVWRSMLLKGWRGAPRPVTGRLSDETAALVGEACPCLVVVVRTVVPVAPPTTTEEVAELVDRSNRGRWCPHADEGQRFEFDVQFLRYLNLTAQYPLQKLHTVS